MLVPILNTDESYDLNPSKIIALGLNYDEHIKESLSLKMKGLTPERPSEPVIFPKAPSSVIGNGENIVLPSFVKNYSFETETRTDYEAELAFIIKEDCRNVGREDAADYIFGYTCLNDVSQRNLQTGDKSGWFRGKSLDTFCPVGPAIVRPEDIPDPQNLDIECRLNGKTVQKGNTSMMIFGIYEIIEILSTWFTLKQGDLISTGTPSGIGPLSSGDIVEVEIEGIGVLRNQVTEEV